MTKKILINLFHPHLNRSRGNRTLADAVRDLENVQLRDVYQEYGYELKIDVKREQELLQNHDYIIFQHPIFWYNCPVLMKMYQEAVLLRNWAYPPGKGDALKGKYYRSVVTTGGPADAYRSGGYNNFTISEFLRAEQQIATLCSMTFLPAFVVHGVLPTESAGGITNQELSAKAAEYRSLLQQDTAL